MSRVLYIKIEESILVEHANVKIGDVAKMECTDGTILNRLKTEPLLELGQNSDKKYVVSVLSVIRKIHEIDPKLEIQNVGETDFIIGLKPRKQSKGQIAIKVFWVSVLSFWGSVFAMMTFNEDVSTLDIFRKVYTWVMGVSPKSPTILELSYSTGVGVGIIVFFNRFGKKRFSEEPSPVEVEMAGYDKQVYNAVIQHAGREGREKDVD